MWLCFLFVMQVVYQKPNRAVLLFWMCNCKYISFPLRDLERICIHTCVHDKFLNPRIFHGTKKEKDWKKCYLNNQKAHFRQNIKIHSSDYKIMHHYYTIVPRWHYVTVRVNLFLLCPTLWFLIIHSFPYQLLIVYSVSGTAVAPREYNCKQDRTNLCPWVAYILQEPKISTKEFHMFKETYDLSWGAGIILLPASCVLSLSGLYHILYCIKWPS